MTGAKSVSSENPTVGSSAGAADAGKAIERMEYPSAGCLRTSAAPIVWIAPGLFSTTMRQPSLSASSFAMMRHMMSGGVPAAVALTIRIMPDGYGSAAPSEPGAESKSASSDSHNGERRRASCFTISHPLDGADAFWGAFQDAPCAPGRRQENAIIPPGGKIDSSLRNIVFRAAEQVEWRRSFGPTQCREPTRSEGGSGVCECFRPFNQARFCLCMKFIRQPAYPNQACCAF